MDEVNSDQTRHMHCTYFICIYFFLNKINVRKNNLRHLTFFFLNKIFMFVSVGRPFVNIFLSYIHDKCTWNYTPKMHIFVLWNNAKHVFFLLVSCHFVVVVVIIRDLLFSCANAHFLIVNYFALSLCFLLKKNLISIKRTVCSVHRESEGNNIMQTKSQIVSKNKIYVI